MKSIPRIYDLKEYDYRFDESLIAKYPLKERDLSRLLVYNRKTDRLEHRLFRDLVEYLSAGDVLVLNDSRVLKARIVGRLGGREVEVFFTRRLDNLTFEGMGKPLRRFKKGTVIEVGEYAIEVLEVLPGKRVYRVHGANDLFEVFQKYGKVPLPPYIDREPTREDEAMYQTVYARKEGSVAAPTAGLHFTPGLLERIGKMGVRIVYVTLHVGPGTFKPVQMRDIREHTLDAEYYEIPDETAMEILKARGEGRRVVAVGTTAVRTLEHWALDERPRRGWTDLFIHPPYEFRVVDALITNFHLPRSTLYMLVAAFIGDIDRTRRVYEVAVEERYRFYSYGDAMLIL